MLMLGARTMEGKACDQVEVFIIHHSVWIRNGMQGMPMRDLRTSEGS